MTGASLDIAPAPPFRRLDSKEWKVDVPEGASGDWKVKRFTVTREDAEWERLRSIREGGRHVPEGGYTGLYHNGQIIMSDTPDEIRDHIEPVRQARGVCLVNGLGLGVVAAAMLRRPEVERVFAIEKSPDVIALVAPHWLSVFGDRFVAVQADAFDYRPPKGIRYGCVWHDIWPDITADNLEGMARLHRKYGRRADWQGSWCRWQCERQRSRTRAWSLFHGN